MTTELQQAIAAIRVGDKETGRRLLAGVLQADPRSETAWLWMSAVVDSDEERRTCLERVLAINPSNDLARRGLERLGASPSAIPPKATTSVPEVPQQPETLAPLQALRARDREATKKCPFCAETIKVEAIVCRFCGRDLETSQQPDRPTKPTKPARLVRGTDTIIPEPVQISPPDHLSHRSQEAIPSRGTPQDYVFRLKGILGDLTGGRERRTRYLRCETVEEAVQRLGEIRLMQKELRLLKKDINLTMRQIRSSFTAKKAEIGKPGFTTGLMAGLFGKKTVGKMNALNREALRQQQKEALSPYESIIKIIDEMLIELDRLKMGLEGAIAKHK